MEYHATAIAWYSTGGYCQKAKPPTNIPRTLWEYRHSRKFFECQYCPKIATTIVHSWQQGAKWFYDEIENDKIASVHRLLSQYSLLAGNAIGPTKNTKLQYCSNIDATIDETRRRVQNDYRVKSPQYWISETDNIDSGFIQDSYGIDTMFWRYWSTFAEKRRRLQNDYWNMMAQLCRSKNDGIHTLLWHYSLLVG